MGVTARIVNIALGVWLFISAFVWPHTMAQRTDTWIVAVLIVLAGAFALVNDGIRFANTALSVWLFFFTLAAPRFNAGTVWNNAIVALIVFLLSLVPSEPIRKGFEQPIQTT